ncbi:MAG: hypothetical protein JXB62_04035 [Pirellulales bacterium]|nr:hypothetical protein [Pirellulales bacterium]
MDKLKVVLSVLKKHHFWVLAGIIVAVALAVWATATADVTKRSDDRKAKIDSKFQAMTRILADAKHPNEETISIIEEKDEAEKEKALETWKKLYQEQKDKNRLPDNLTSEFKTFFESGEEIPQEYRAEYQIFLRGYVGELFFEKLDQIRPKGWKYGDPEPTSKEMVGIVDWDGWEDIIRSRFEWATPPGTELIRQTQEDLWVYEALVRIIRNTNEGATRPDMAAVKRINAMEIGADVAGLGTGSRGVGITLPQAGAAAAMKQDSGGRYVDEDGQALSPGKPGPFAEFKMMPIRLDLLVDQTMLPKLMVECANSTMPIEIRSVRLWPNEGSLFNPNEAGKPALTRGKSTQSSDAAADATAYRYIPVEIEGIICIYNPPDMELLGTGAAAEQPAGAPPTTPAVPAPTTPPAATPPATPPATTPPATPPATTPPTATSGTASSAGTGGSP